MSRVRHLFAALGFCAGASLLPAEDYEMRLSKRVEEKPGQFRMVESVEKWNPVETAVIVCDMWDLHHCKNAVDRAVQMAPRMNALLKAARKRGSLIVHAPSSCMEFYRDHPARRRAQSAPRAGNVPEGIDQWLTWIDEREKKAGYPIDHSDGGEDDDPQEHAAWAAKLKDMGRNPRAPWTRQLDLLEIDGEKDAITDNGTENWNLLEQHGVKNVILLGVHTNMCVLGRPFGLRQMARNGKNVVLMRDLTDTMYNPEMEPKVSHFQGTDLIVEHIEKYVCPTVTSDQILGGAPYRFKTDPRRHIVFLVGEREYRTRETLPVFAARYLSSGFRSTFVYADPEGEERNRFRGIEAVKDADVLFVSVRRRALPEKDLKLIREHVQAGKPVVGIRTASHAFSLRGKPAPDGHAVWEKWDAEVIGGSYSGHHGNKFKTRVWSLEKAAPFLGNGTPLRFESGGSLYINTPTRPGQKVLLMGEVEGVDRAEPLAWTFSRSDGGRTFYTSLGHVSDFEQAGFNEMLARAVAWCVEKPEGQ
ncbi:MAG: nicotinamidase [Roseibacillus sp.]|nr:nicotinamidase [Roseibacillus sp.]